MPKWLYNFISPPTGKDGFKESCLILGKLTWKINIFIENREIMKYIQIDLICFFNIITQWITSLAVNSVEKENSELRFRNLGVSVIYFHKNAA